MDPPVVVRYVRLCVELFVGDGEGAEGAGVERGTARGGGYGGRPSLAGGAACCEGGTFFAGVRHRCCCVSV